MQRLFRREIFSQIKNPAPLACKSCCSYLSLINLLASWLKPLENIRQKGETDRAKKRLSWAVCWEGGCRAAAAFQPSCWLKQTHGGLGSLWKQAGLSASGWEPGDRERASLVTAAAFPSLVNCSLGWNSPSMRTCLKIILMCVGVYIDFRNHFNFWQFPWRRNGVGY